MSNGESTARGYFGTFVWAVLLGMGFHVGWGLISLIIWVLAKSVGQEMPPVLR